MSTTIEEQKGTRATVTEFSEAKKGDGIRCQDCVNYDDDEHNVLDVCNECTRFGHTEGIKDNFVAAPTFTLDITLTILAISEDGETATVEDQHGNTAEIPTGSFTHDADDLDVGKTLLCHVLDRVIDGTPLYPDNVSANFSAADPEDQPTNYGTAYIKSESITVPLPLAAEEREEAGTRMASALSRKSQLEDQLDTFRNRINAQIKELDSEAAAASSEWLNGKSEQEVYCNVVADYDAGAIIWRNQETGEEVKRRPMTGEERQLRLPIPAPSESRVSHGEGVADQAELPMGETEAYDPDSARTCINCGHLAEDNTMDLPEACQTCRRGGNGDTDGWTERKECGSCMHSATPVDYPPCKTCQLNPQKPGKKDNWQGKDAAAEVESTEEGAE